MRPTRRVRVPQSGRAESLNLAAAATVCLFEWQRRRRACRRGAREHHRAAAHDIRSPLTAMKGFGYALERRWETMTEEQRALMLQGIVHDADRMDTILRQLVDAARVVGGTLEVFPRTGRRRRPGARGRPRRSAAIPTTRRWSGSATAGTVFADPARLKTTLLAFCESLVWWGDDGAIVVDGRDRSRTCSPCSASRSASGLTDDEVEALFTPRGPAKAPAARSACSWRGAWLRRRAADAGARSVDGGSRSTSSCRRADTPPVRLTARRTASARLGRVDSGPSMDPDEMLRSLEPGARTRPDGVRRPPRRSTSSRRRRSR